MEKGDIVKFKDGLYRDEGGVQYTVKEVNGNRCFLEFISDLPVNPVSVAMVDELVVIEGGKEIKV